MPLFGSSSPFDINVEKATNENNTKEDWGLIMEICDAVGSTPNGPKECLKSIVKRMHHQVPHVAMQALTVLDACINNCGKNFHLEVASREFETEIRKLLGAGRAHQKVIETLKQLIKKLAENEFKTDPQLNLIPSLYSQLKSEGVDFSTSEPPKKSSVQFSKNPNAVDSQQEEVDIAKAIELSLKETQQSPKSKSLYPTARPASPTLSTQSLRKVRALYDFEAAEDNELTFKAGELINILDDGDPNWWKGTNSRGEGLFPANFVTADLTAEPEQFKLMEKKSVQFSEVVEVKTVETEPQVVEIDEAKIDRLLHLLHEADPTGERPDSAELISLEDQCQAMGPLIDQELEKNDRKHAALNKLGKELMDALGMYHDLMREYPPQTFYVPQMKMTAAYPYQAPQAAMPAQSQQPVPPDGYHHPGQFPQQYANMPGPYPVPQHMQLGQHPNNAGIPISNQPQQQNMPVRMPNQNMGGHPAGLRMQVNAHQPETPVSMGHVTNMQYNAFPSMDNYVMPGNVGQQQYMPASGPNSHPSSYIPIQQHPPQAIVSQRPLL